MLHETMPTRDASADSRGRAGRIQTTGETESCDVQSPSDDALVHRLQVHGDLFASAVAKELDGHSIADRVMVENGQQVIERADGLAVHACDHVSDRNRSGATLPDATQAGNFSRTASNHSSDHQASYA